MNEAQFLLSLGMKPRAKSTGLAAPAIESERREVREVFDADLGGTVVVPKGRTPKGQTPWRHP